jgi:beta-lactam-binding protein with PASTA domain
MGGQRRVTTVPDVIGLEATTAAAAVLAAGLTPFGRNYAPAPESGSITDQSPEPGARAVPGAPIILETEPGGGGGAAPGSPVPSGADEFAPA